MGTDSPEVRPLPHRGISYRLLANVCLKLERLWKVTLVSGSPKEWMRPMLQLHPIHLISLQGPFPHSLTGTHSWKTPQQNSCKQITASESISFVNPTYISSLGFVLPFQSSLFEQKVSLSTQFWKLNTWTTVLNTSLSLSLNQIHLICTQALWVYFENVSQNYLMNLFCRSTMKTQT